MKPFHTEFESLDRDECLKILKRNQYCHLGCTDGSECYVVPMSYVFDGEDIFCHSREGKKLDLLRTELFPYVQVEEVQDFYNWKSVGVKCRFEEMEGEELFRATRVLIKGLEHEHKSSPLEEDFAAYLETSVVFKLRILDLSGRAELRNLRR